MGSRDRRTASMLLYDYFRIGRSVEELDVHQRLATGLFLCERESPFCALLNSEMNRHIEEPLEKKLIWAKQKLGFSPDSIFPAADKVSSAIDSFRFFVSHLIQPRVFLYVHPGEMKTVQEILNKEEIAFKEHGPQTLSVDNGAKLTSIPALRGKFQVQDIASQSIAQLYKAQPKEAWWDACAGSGGKSIVLKHLFPQIRLTVSDIRPSILRNLDGRFSEAGITEYRKKILDLNVPVSDVMNNTRFDGIILDAPCSGSGTWSRTPEVLSFFTRDRIAEFANRQLHMALNVLPYLKTGKPLIYVTCSVYQQENEAIVSALEEQGMQTESQKYFHGYNHQGDTLFAARLIKK